MNVKSLSSFTRSHISLTFAHPHYMHTTNVLFYNINIIKRKQKIRNQIKYFRLRSNVPAHCISSSICVAFFQFNPWFHLFSLYCVLVSRIIICYTSLRCRLPFSSHGSFGFALKILHEIDGCVCLCVL